jgi:hypothetical protein
MGDGVPVGGPFIGPVDEEVGLDQDIGVSLVWPVGLEQSWE